MTYLVPFIGGYAVVAAAGHDPTQLLWDWLALSMALSAVGWSQPAMATAPVTIQVMSAAGAFLVGYGSIEVSSGFRYGVSFNWIGIVTGLSAAGLIHSNNPNFTQPLANAAQQIAGIKNGKP